MFHNICWCFFFFGFFFWFFFGGGGGFNFKPLASTLPGVPKPNHTLIYFLNFKRGDFSPPPPPPHLSFYPTITFWRLSKRVRDGGGRELIYNQSNLDWLCLLIVYSSHERISRFNQFRSIFRSLSNIVCGRNLFDRIPELIEGSTR